MQFDVGPLPEEPLAASAQFHAELLPKIYDAGAGEDLVLVFAPAGHTHRGWRLAVVQELARAAAPRRVNAVESDDRAGIAAATAYLAAAHPLPPETLALAERADAILFGAVGDPQFDALERDLRPEQAILGLRKKLRLFANLRPARLIPGLEDASALKPEIARAIDLLIVRDTLDALLAGMAMHVPTQPIVRMAMSDL